METPPSEAPLERTSHGLAPAGAGWFVLDAREGRWGRRDGLAKSLRFDAPVEFPQLGINLFVLASGEPIGLYHWESDQEDFLVLAGVGLLLVEGQQRPLRQWDFVHCPAYTKHMIVGAGDGGCVVLAVGAREHQFGEDWGGYTVNEVAAEYGASVERDTADPGEAYARFPEHVPLRYEAGWLPELG